jgi:hypothetical protein
MVGRPAAVDDQAAAWIEGHVVMSGNSIDAWRGVKGAEIPISLLGARGVEAGLSNSVQWLR